MNKIEINDFIALISSSKIISSNDTRNIFNEGESQLGFYILIKGSLLVKISKMSMPKHIDLFFKKEILQEYNLEEDSKIIWLNTNEYKEYNNKSLIYKFLSEDKMINFSPYSSIFHKKHIDRINTSKRRYTKSYSKDSFDEKIKKNIIINEDIDLFIYNLDGNDSLFFGGVNIFNDYMRENSQIHLTSAYIYSKKIYQEKENNTNTIMLYIPEDKIKELFRKISLLNKERVKFLLNKLTPLNEMNSIYIRFFISNIKMIYINSNSEKELINNKNNFYLVYQGTCWEKKKKEIIYDQGTFIGLNNIFNNNNNTTHITLYSKGYHAILFKIDLNYLSINNQEDMKNFLKNILANQYIVRSFYMNQVMSYENKKIKEKEKEIEEQIRKYLCSNSINILSRIDKNAYTNNYQNSNNNEKCLNSIIFNKNNNLYQEIKSAKILVQNKEFPFKKKKIKYFLKNESKSTSNSPKTSSSNLPYVIFNNSEKSIIINNNGQNPINNISIIKCPKNQKGIKNNNINKCYKIKNNIFTLKNLSRHSYVSSHSYSCFNNNTIINNKKNNHFNKSMLLRNINEVQTKGKQLLDLYNESSH